MWRGNLGNAAVCYGCLSDNCMKQINYWPPQLQVAEGGFFLLTTPNAKWMPRVGSGGGRIMIRFFNPLRAACPFVLSAWCMNAALVSYIMYHADPTGLMHSWSVSMMLECSTGELLAGAAFMHHDDHWHWSNKRPLKVYCLWRVFDFGLCGDRMVNDTTT